MIEKSQSQSQSQKCNDEPLSITNSSQFISLYFERNDGKIPYLFHLIDTPGDMNMIETNSLLLNIVDGALIVVDCIEGVCVQTETVLRQAMEEDIVPILFLNKMDRVFLELNCQEEEIYQKLSKTIESVNTVIETYHYNGDDNKSNDFNLVAASGKVGFGSGLHGWGFTLKTFADLYAKKYGFETKQLMTTLWGDYYFDSKNKKWVELDSKSSKKKKSKRKKRSGRSNTPKRVVRFSTNACENPKSPFKIEISQNDPLTPFTKQKKFFNFDEDDDDMYDVLDMKEQQEKMKKTDFEMTQIAKRDIARLKDFKASSKSPDVVGDSDQSLFKVITNRYFKSGYPRVMDVKQ